MAKASQLTNTEQASQAIIRLLCDGWEKFDKNSPHFYERDLSGTIRYPYRPTLSGLTQSPELSKKTLGFLALSLASFVL